MPTFEDYKSEWLLDIAEGNPNTVVLGNRFARKLITQWIDIEDDPVNLIFCDGGGDGGIDVAFLLRGDSTDDEEAEGDTWYLVQSKYGSAFSGVSTLFIESKKIIDTLTGERKNLSSIADDLKEKLYNFSKQSSQKDKLVLLFATIDPLTESEKNVLADIQLIGNSKLSVKFEVEAISINTIYQRILGNIALSVRHEVEFVANLVSSGQDLLVGSCKLINLFHFLKAYRAKTGDLDLLYEKNVRKFLGSRKKVNKGIADTLTDYPERFGLYNNGITIVVEDFDQSETDKFLLTEPYIVNGCQTTRTIWETVSRKLDAGGTGVNPEIELWKDRLNKGIVVVKIVKVGAQGEELLTDTTRYTNSQNAVSQKDFIALESNFKSWAREMGQKYDVYLEIQRGGWDSQKLFQRQNMNVKLFDKWANAFDLLKVIGAAWLNEPGLAFGKNPPFAPGGSIFKKIVDRPEFCVEDLYAAYLLHKLSEKIQFGRKASKSSRGQTRYLFYYVIMELLKECIIQIGQPTSPEFLTKSVIKVFSDIHSPASVALEESALNVIDDYLTKENDDSLFKEPAFTGDLNAFMKSDKLGAGSAEVPKLHNLISLNKLLMRKSFGGQPPSRDLITNILEEL